MALMKTVLYWDSDHFRIRQVVQSFAGTAVVHCMPSLLELRTAAQTNQPTAVVLGSSAQTQANLVSQIDLCKNPDPPPVFVLTDGTNRPGLGPTKVHYVVVPQELDRLVNEIRVLPDTLAPTGTGRADPELSSVLLGNSSAIREVGMKVRRYADSPNPVLVLGETGTGKELVANALHRLSLRKNKELVALNCAAMPETLIESELFGAEKGAYTDAVTRKGAIGRASGGTLFLDEIGSMAQSAQPKLLRVVETGEYYPLGSERPQKSDFRLVSASCKNPVDMAQNGQFRPDLLFRISDLIIFIPPLRDRKEDIPLLAEHFCRLAGSGACELSSQAMEKLVAFSWPGNVRELRSVITRACVNVQSGLIRASDISFISDFHDIFRPLAG